MAEITEIAVNTVIGIENRQKHVKCSNKSWD